MTSLVAFDVFLFQPLELLWTSLEEWLNILKCEISEETRLQRQASKSVSANIEAEVGQLDINDRDRAHSLPPDSRATQVKIINKKNIVEKT